MNENLDALVARLNDDADPAHAEWTPAVRALARLGMPALARVLPLLAAADEDTRMRAQKVLELASRDWVVHRLPAGTPGDAVAARWQALWDANGGYRWQGEGGVRARAIARWQAWLAAPRMEDDDG